MGRCLLVRLGVIGLTGLVACASLDGLSGGSSGDGGGGRDATTDARLDARAHTGADGRTDGRVEKEASRESDAFHPLDALADSPREDVTGHDSGRDSGHDAGRDAAQPKCPGFADALLCDNFDVSPLGALWNQQSLIAGALTLSSVEAVSPPNSLLSVINPNGTSGEGSASLVYMAAQTFSKLRNSYDIYVEQVGQRSAAIGSIYLLNGLRYYGVYLFVRGGGTAMDIAEEGTSADGGDDTTLHSFPAFPLQTWIRVILEVDYGASPTVTLTLEDPPLTPATPILNAIPIAPTITGVTMSAYAGIDYVAFPETTGWQVYIDNVVLEAPP